MNCKIAEDRRNLATFIYSTYMHGVVKRLTDCDRALFRFVGKLRIEAGEAGNQRDWRRRWRPSYLSLIRIGLAYSELI